LTNTSSSRNRKAEPIARSPLPHVGRVWEGFSAASLTTAHDDFRAFPNTSF
jgi:hypothetical protein